MKRKVAVIVGSKSDLKNCNKGLIYLKYSEEVEIAGVYVMSQHRNTLEVQDLLRELSDRQVEAVVVGAGWANHLTGCCDAFLRYTLGNMKLVVIGVAFEDPDNKNHTQAAILSITEVPGTQVVFEDQRGQFVGHGGFYHACKMAAVGDLPKIKLPTPKESMRLSIDEAIAMAS